MFKMHGRKDNNFFPPLVDIHLPLHELQYTPASYNSKVYLLHIVIMYSGTMSYMYVYMYMYIHLYHTHMVL